MTHDPEAGVHWTSRALYRLEEHRTGRPDYPEPVTWGLIETWVNGTIIKGEEKPRQPDP